MNAVQITIADGKITEQVLGPVRGGIKSIHAGLEMYACRLYGREGKNWRMVQATDRRLIPFFVREIDGLHSEIHVQ